MMKTKINLWWLAPALLLGLLAGIFLFRGENDTSEHVHDVSVATEYTCSMHPQIRRNEPGQCPICGMDLIPLSDLGDNSAEGAVRLSSGAIRLGNIRTVRAGTGGSAAETITLNGVVVPDENNIRIQSSHVEGRVEQLFINSAGLEVRKGQRIATLYSPKLIAAQQELLQAVEMKDSQPQLLAAARQKMRSFRLSETQIDEIISSGSIRNTIDIHAEWAGTVLEIMIRTGDHVTAGSSLYRLADLSDVWVEFDAYESDLPVIDGGDDVTFTVTGVPGKTYEGTVSFIDPVVDPVTRVARIRVETDNPDGKLKPQMFAKGTISSQGIESGDRLMIPRSAVLWTGQRSVVYVLESSDESGSVFSMQEITLGPAVGEYYVVENGLAPGVEIVANGTFTVDAAAQLAGKPSMMNVQASEDEPIIPGDPPANISLAADSLIGSYITLKDRLVSADFAGAVAEAVSLRNTFHSFAALEVNDQWTDWWTDLRDNLGKHITQAAEANNIDELRRIFIGLSEYMVDLQKTASDYDYPVYVMRCPMANNNQGARWLSLEEEVQNPYYGDMMLTCGSVTETIE